MKSSLNKSYILFLLVGFFLSNTTLIYKAENLFTDSCFRSLRSRVVKLSISKIMASNKARLTQISCDELKKMNELSDNKIFITTGRNRGEAIICMSDKKNKPCKFKIGVIDRKFDASAALLEIYSFDPPRADVLNETLERLFIYPSRLMQ